MTTMAYISSGSSSDDLQALKENPLIQEYASMDDEIYNLIKATNPTLLMFVDLAKKIVSGGNE
ncbi:hypothetical protein [Methanolobus vulcani]|uniref:Uncharacterized protein n=1 Tax=Methanolobus vulcani TaxID=38026 RepID=A0A7Z8P377_9EURY|nr:hypothetical protein [Methanolobus vulcani]TQD28273.1 hypothetical protein FKV42_00960 [Methanolobus vulcani]